MIPASHVANTKLCSSRIGLGAVTFGREIDEEVSREILDHAVQSGINLIDTAEAYISDISDTPVTGEPVTSEHILGRWMRDRACRDDMVILTKCSSGGRSENIRRALAQSLDRLKTDHIDIYMLHSPDPLVPLDETLDALSREVDAGRVRSIGLSNHWAGQMREALQIADRDKLHRIASVQPPYSLALPDADEGLFALCEREGIAAITYSPLAAGFLTGKYRAGAMPTGSRFAIKPGHRNIYFSDRNFRMVERLCQTAEERGVSVVRLAMAWVLGDPRVTTMLIGARTTQHVDNALDALKLRLNADERERMRHAAD